MAGSRDIFQFYLWKGQNKKLIYDPKFVYSHKPMSHHKIRFHLILLPKFLKFFFRTNWFRFNRNYRASHSTVTVSVTFSWTFWGPPKNGVLPYNFFPFRIFLDSILFSLLIKFLQLFLQVKIETEILITWYLNIGYYGCLHKNVSKFQCCSWSNSLVWL